MLGWDRYIFHKKRAMTRDTELALLLPVGLAGHIVHSSAPRAWNVKHYFLARVEPMQFP
jgi:hypothetical protein